MRQLRNGTAAPPGNGGGIRETCAPRDWSYVNDGRARLRPALLPAAGPDRKPVYLRNHVAGWQSPCFAGSASYCRTARTAHGLALRLKLARSNWRCAGIAGGTPGRLLDLAQPECVRQLNLLNGYPGLAKVGIQGLQWA